MSTTSAEIRANLNHPIIDSDGHWAELFPILFEYVEEVAGSKVLERFRSGYGQRFHGWYAADTATRRRNRMRRPSYWGVPTNKDRVASLIPGVFRSELDSWGIDVAVVYPTIGLTLARDVNDRELVNGVIRAYNVMVADLFAP